MGLRSPTVSKCYDCVVPDPYVCPHTCLDVAESESGDGWTMGTFDSTIYLDANEGLRDVLCADRRADPNVTDPTLANETTKRLKNQAGIAANGAIFNDAGAGDDWLFPGDLEFEYGTCGPECGDPAYTGPYL